MNVLLPGDHNRDIDVDHVLLISVDGLHESDAAGFIAGHPDGALAKLGQSGRLLEAVDGAGRPRQHDRRRPAHVHQRGRPERRAVFASFVNPNDGSTPVVKGLMMADDAELVWLQDQSPANVVGVVAQLTNPANAAAMFANVLPPGTIFNANVSFGHDIAEIDGDPTSGDPIAAARAPNVFIQPNWGVIYSGSSKKISEHGGGTLDDTHVALIVSHPALDARTVGGHVFTKQVAPTILRALDLDPDALEAVATEHTKVLPGLEL